ncbi:serine O-acetyltransferase [Pedobacter suwonensis]|uniref:serine O-acetyltransferase n=1 Tax=Pedobacter suwonensis TaxID=332999 RepID=UPI0011A35C6F|nr:serine acetyltransferase [Pedobacter suwonensis]
MRTLLFYLKVPFFIPHYLFFILNEKPILGYELLRWGEVLRINKSSKHALFFELICNLKEYRSLFYHRLGGKALLVSWYAPGIPNLYFDVPSSVISKGLVIQHGHSSRFNPESCGENCQIWHNSTVGKGKPGGAKPVLGNNVLVTTGACVIGDIKIGNNVVIGANAVVVKDVPDDSVVVGNPSRIVRLKGEKVNIML